MSLMVKARARAAWHIAENIREWRHHRIWRLYRWFGFDTRAIGCECGVVFQARTPLDAARLLSMMNRRKAR